MAKEITSKPINQHKSMAITGKVKGSVAKAPTKTAPKPYAKGGMVKKGCKKK